MKILVTGGTGFIGSHTANFLHKKGHDVTICDNNFRGKFDDSVKHLNFIQCDLTKIDELEKLDTDYDCVYHFAAINGTGNFYEIPHLVLKVNALANINILDWCVKNKIKKILSTSSSEVYASTPNKSIPTKEEVSVSIDNIYNPRFSYAASKIFGESLFLNYHTQFDLEVKIVRPHNIYGARMGFEHVIPQVIKRIYKKESPFKIYGHDQSRSFCYIDDAVRLLELVMDKKASDGKIIHLGTEVETKIDDLVYKLFDICDFHPEVEFSDPVIGSVSRRCPDVSLLSEITGYRSKCDLDYGLRESCKWYLDYYRKQEILD